MGKKILKRSLLVLLLLLTMVCGATFALMFRQTEQLDNQFAPATVTCEVKENFAYPVKSGISVKNTSNIEAYLRVRLVTYWVDSAGNILFLPASIPAFALGENWIRGSENTYYYALPVAPDGVTGNLLGGSITMEQDDETGNYQVIEVFADAIQSKPVKAVTDSWEVILDGVNIHDAP